MKKVHSVVDLSQQASRFDTLQNYRDTHRNNKSFQRLSKCFASCLCRLELTCVCFLQIRRPCLKKKTEGQSKNLKTSTIESGIKAFQEARCRYRIHSQANETKTLRPSTIKVPQLVKTWAPSTIHRARQRTRGSTPRI